VSGPRTAIARAQPDAGPDVAGLLKRPEVRDVLAWLRLLVDPQDAAAVVRALGRPPVELRQVDLARVIQVVRRRKLDLVAGLTAATEAPQVPPEARERIQRFVDLHRGAASEMKTARPDVFLERLIERLQEPGRALFTQADATAHDESMAAVKALAGEFLREHPSAGVRELVRHLTTFAPPEGGQPQPLAVEQDLQQRLEETLSSLREEVLGGVGRIGGRLAELRLDTDLDLSHGVVRYLELIKLAALLQRPQGQSLTDALADINARLRVAATPLQREILETSTLDASLQAGEPPSLSLREEHSLAPFLPRKGEGLALSASDIETYRACPLRYKFARVLRIPTEPTVHQRFGIAVHQVLERFHDSNSARPGSLAELLELLDAGWRRSGLGLDGHEGELLQKAREALTLYHERLQGHESEPVWFERPFAFRLGSHHLRGRVDRVDRTGEGEDAVYELIDYKTSRPKSEEQLRQDVQLSLYALAAKEDWGLDCSRQAYYYILDDLKVPVSFEDREPEWVRDVVLEVGDGIMRQDFDPTPTPAACAMCDYRIVCPAAAL
jgi:RecB family exonuclease